MPLLNAFALQVRAEADNLRRDLTQQTQRLSELTAQLEQERGQSEWQALPSGVHCASVRDVVWAGVSCIGA